MKIESSKNAVYKDLLALTKSKGLKDQGRCLVSGEKITHEISKLAINSFWIKTDKMSLPTGQWQKTITLSTQLFNALDVCGTKKPLLCADFKSPKSFHDIEEDKATLYVALSDPTNLGALVRTCAAFGWEQIVLLKESAHPFLPKAIRAASGTCFATKFFSGPAIDDLTDPEIMALDMHGKVVGKTDLKKNMKLLVGEEGKGIPDNFLGKKLQIPISNKVESLNATIATSLIIYDWSKV